MEENQLELADMLAESQRNAGIALARKSMATETDPNFDGVHCIEEDCGEPIPPGRLALGRIRCTECASRIERRGRTAGVTYQHARI